MILAAGRGERMRPLTDAQPKPLLPARGRPLIEWHLVALAAAGIRTVVINTAWLEEQIPAALGDGSRWGLDIHYSMEGRDHGGALETAGGIAKAMPLLGDSFWLVSGDIFVPDFAYDRRDAARFLDSGRLAHLWLVPNPDFHAKGDFGIGANGLGLADTAGPDGRRWTYSNLALVRPGLCAHVLPGQKAPLGPLLFESMRRGEISVEPYLGEWHNVGTPRQLEQLAQLKAAV
ncbi:MAG: N-acetylmuramate alpha-1-phosphate uridylyltransferase MurU [Ramlibacter sp.]